MISGSPIFIVDLTVDMSPLLLLVEDGGIVILGKLRLSVLFNQSFF